MPTKIKQLFVNLPVRDLNRSVAFFESLGFSFDPQFTDDTATCLILGNHIFAMLLTEERFSEFTDLEIGNAHRNTEVLLALDVERRENVDNMVKMAVAAGGHIYAKVQDHGWMYQHSFADLDGHKWEVFAMDTNKIPSRPSA